MKTYVQSSAKVTLLMSTGKPHVVAAPTGTARACADAGGILHRVPVTVTYQTMYTVSTILCLPQCCTEDGKRWVAAQLVFSSIGDFFGEMRSKFAGNVAMGFIGPLPTSDEGLSLVLPVSEKGYWLPYYERAEPDMDIQWSKLVYPMIRGSNFTRVLEVGAGRCRNTEKLVAHSGHIVVTDIDASSVNACRKRFRNRPVGRKIEYLVVDGMHVPIKNESVSLVYQFDSGVHFHRQVIQSYLQEFNRVLIPGGTGFFHYSNLGASEQGVLDDLNPLQNVQARSNMTRSLFEFFAREAGLEVVCNPTVDWNRVIGLDAFARFRKPGGLLWASTEDACPRGLAYDWNGVRAW